MNIYRFLSGLYYAGLILIFAGTVMQLSNSNGAFWVFSLGLLPVVGIRVFNVVVASPHTRRKNLILLASALFLAVAAVAIYYHRSYWVLFIAIAAILDGYVSFRRVK